jgi:hypothetical protein
MTFIDTSTSREDLLTAVYGDLNAVDFFIKADIDPEFVGDDVIRETLIAFIEAGDECARS